LCYLRRSRGARQVNTLIIVLNEQDIKAADSIAWDEMITYTHILNIESTSRQIDATYALVLYSSTWYENIQGRSENGKGKIQINKYT
jgi:hypothetical protein